MWRSSCFRPFEEGTVLHSLSDLGTLIKKSVDRSCEGSPHICPCLHCHFVQVGCKIKKHVFSLFIILFDIVCSSGSLGIPYEFWNQFVNFCKESSWDSDRDGFEFVGQSGEC